VFFSHISSLEKIKSHLCIAIGAPGSVMLHFRWMKLKQNRRNFVTALVSLYKYQVSQFRLLMQRFRLRTTCSQWPQRYFSSTTELSEAESEEGRILTITKIAHEANWQLNFVDGKCGCAADSFSHHTWCRISANSQLSNSNKRNRICDCMWVLVTKIVWLTDRRSERNFGFVKLDNRWGSVAARSW
jgi:hypothetical protein